MSDVINDIPVHALVEISVDPNFTAAFIEVSAPKNGGNDVTVEQVKEVLVEKNVYYGVFDDAINSIVEQKRYGENICIARWKPPVDGVDGTITYYYDKDSVVAPVEDEQGNVDFKNLGLVTNIFKGTSIATITMPTEGEPGTDISGKPIMQHIGVPVNIHLGQNTILTEDGTEIIAATDGNLKFVGGSFAVDEELILQGDVDVSSGNIDFIGNVIIKGNVFEGYSVSSKKNITINGTVTSATIKADGDITVKLGIINSTIECQGNVKVGFCENSKIHCEHNVEAATFVGGEVYAGENILASGKGVMMGGKYTALKNIEAAVIGSEGYAKTVLTLGNNAVLSEERDSINVKIAELEDKVDQLGKILTTLTELAKAAKLSPEREHMKVEAMKSRFQLQGEIKRLRNRVTEIERTLELKQNLSVSCRKEFFPGVVIRINSFIYQVNVSTSRSKATIGDEGIVFLPL